MDFVFSCHVEELVNISRFGSRETRILARELLKRSCKFDPMKVYAFFTMHLEEFLEIVNSQISHESIKDNVIVLPYFIQIADPVLR